MGRKGGRKQVRKEWWRKVTEGGSREEIRGRVRGYYWKREISMVGNKKHGGGWLIWICTHAHSSIQGFMQKSDAEKLLLQCSPGTFLIRFSEGDPGGVSVAWVTGMEHEGLTSF